MWDCRFILEAENFSRLYPNHKVIATLMEFKEYIASFISAITVNDSLILFIGGQFLGRNIKEATRIPFFPNDYRCIQGIGNPLALAIGSIKQYLDEEAIPYNLQYVQC